jgi:hypothetical protein
MAPPLPTPIELNAQQKKAIIEGLKKVIIVFEGNGLLETGVTYSRLIHEPELLYGFIQSYRQNPNLVAEIAVDATGSPVMSEDEPLNCGVSLGQIQQLLVRTCGRHFLEQDTRQEEATFMATVVTKNFFGFKKTQKVEKKTGGGFDQRKVRELSPLFAFDWQLPLLAAYSRLDTLQISALGTTLLELRSEEALQTVAQFDANIIKKAKAVTGEEFSMLLSSHPQAIAGVVEWPTDMYLFYRNLLGENSFEFFARDKNFFMLCAGLTKAMAAVYGDVLAYIAAPNLEEIQRLNLDQTDVLIQSMKAAFGDKIRMVLGHPKLSREVLHRLVESLLHLDFEKPQLLASTELTCKAIAPQVMAFLAKQEAQPSKAG